MIQFVSRFLLLGPLCFMSLTLFVHNRLRKGYFLIEDSSIKASIFLGLQHKFPQFYFSLFFRSNKVIDILKVVNLFFDDQIFQLKILFILLQTLPQHLL